MIDTEKLVEEYCNNEVPFDTTESGEKLYTENDLKYAYLTALKVGSQLDMIWHDYDAGEDCYEDSHKGRWIKRESQWHYVKDRDFPTEKGCYLVCRKHNGQKYLELLGFDGKYWITGLRDDPEDFIIAWKSEDLPEEE